MLTLDQNNVATIEYPMYGSEYIKSIEEMFPEQYQKNMLLKNKMSITIVFYLGTINEIEQLMQQPMPIKKVWAFLKSIKSYSKSKLDYIY